VYRNECIVGGQHCLLGIDERCSKVPGKCGNTTTSPNPSPSPSPSAPALSLACTGITRTPDTAPVIGSTLTFTCASSATPAKTTVSYEFRYAVNEGEWKSLSTTKANTAQMTISACGNYKVQCRACTKSLSACPDGRICPTIAEPVVTCDPIWTGATQ
jgi:hypothetical protein